MLDGRVLGVSQVEYKPFGKLPLKREKGRCSPTPAPAVWVQACGEDVHAVHKPQRPSSHFSPDLQRTRRQRWLWSPCLIVACRAHQPLRGLGAALALPLAALAIGLAFFLMLLVVRRQAREVHPCVGQWAASLGAGQPVEEGVDPKAAGEDAPHEAAVVLSSLSRRSSRTCSLRK